MDGIPKVRFVPVCLLHIFGVCQHRLKPLALQYVINRDPVFPGGLHTDIWHVLAFDVAVGGSELVDIKNEAKSVRIRPADRSQKNLLMDINARADRASDICIGKSNDVSSIVKSKGPDIFGCISPPVRMCFRWVLFLVAAIQSLLS